MTSRVLPLPAWDFDLYVYYEDSAEVRYPGSAGAGATTRRPESLMQPTSLMGPSVFSLFADHPGKDKPAGGHLP